MAERRLIHTMMAERRLLHHHVVSVMLAYCGVLAVRPSSNSREPWTVRRGWMLLVMAVLMMVLTDRRRAV